MAQTDTGLGWSAKDNYLVQTGPVQIGTLRTMGGDDFPNQPPATNCGTAADVIANGMYCIIGDLPDDCPNIYVASANQYDILVCEVQDATYVNLHCISMTNSAVVAIGDQFSNTTRYRTRNDWTLDAATGLYYIDNIFNGLKSSYQLAPGIPSFLTRRSALDAVTIATTNLYKLYPGYAVATIAKWYSPAGVEITSPVLISTEKDITTLSLDGSSVAIQITESHAYNGLVFYMSYITNLEGTSPSGIVPIVDLTQFGAAYGSKVFKILASDSFANIQLTQAPPDPYNEDPSEEEGGGGDELEDDPVEEETLPVPSVAGHGFCTVYVPSSQELGQMASYLWSGSFDVDQVIKLFSNPMDSILGLSAVPVDLVGTPEQIYLGGVALTGITMPKYTGRTSVKVDFGTATIPERWGSYLDYDPYTEFSIYLPFIGIKPLKADDIVGKTIRLMYDIDILSGGCVAYIRVEGSSVLYEWSGQCAVQIPVTARNYDNVFQSAMSVVGAVGAAIVAPASAPVLSGAVASAAVQAAASKPRIERSGTVNGITGFLGQLRPYIIRTIPQAFIPADQNRFIGYPAYINVYLGSIEGYNEVSSIHLENVPATGAELEEIESILKGGVIY